MRTLKFILPTILIVVVMIYMSGVGTSRAVQATPDVTDVGPLGLADDRPPNVKAHPSKVRHAPNVFSSGWAARSRLWTGRSYMALARGLLDRYRAMR